MQKLLEREFNPLSGNFEEIHYDHGADKLILHNYVDNSALIEQNIIEQNSGNNGFTPGRNFRKIAEIDEVTQLKLLTEHDIDFNRWNHEDQSRFKRWLKNSENAYFRTYSGKI